MHKDISSYVGLALAWFVHLPLISKLLVSFGIVFLFSGLFGWLPPRPFFSVRLMCLGLSWDYFFRLKLASFRKDEYHDGSVKMNWWIDYSRVVGGMFFLV